MSQLLHFVTCILIIVTIGDQLKSINGQLVGVEKCGEERAREFAECTATPLIMRPDGHFPTTAAEASVYCDKSLKAVPCMKKFAKQCLGALPRQALSLLTYSINKQLRNVCKTPQSRAGKFIMIHYDYM